MACGLWDPNLRNDSAHMYLPTYWTAITGKGDITTQPSFCHYHSCVGHFSVCHTNF